MECKDRTLLDQWIAAWTDLVEFSVTPVMTSADAAAKFTPTGRRRAKLGRAVPSAVRVSLGGR
jgi:hypothetical protein